VLLVYSEIYYVPGDGWTQVLVRNVIHYILVLFMNQFLPEYTIRVVSNFFENSRRYSQLKVHLWEVWLTYRNIFAFKFTLRSQQPVIVPIVPMAQLYMNVQCMYQLLCLI
jgi:hypothetical protein